jgi:hypothetical protein
MATGNAVLGAQIIPISTARIVIVIRSKAAVLKTAQPPCLTCADTVNEGELRHVFDMIKLLGGHLTDATLIRLCEYKSDQRRNLRRFSGHSQGRWTRRNPYCGVWQHGPGTLRGPMS